MQKQGVCQICGKSIPVGCHICHTCKVQADSQKEWTGYQPGYPILVSSDFVQHFMRFYRQSFSDPEIEAAYQAHLQNAEQEIEENNSEMLNH